MKQKLKKVLGFVKENQTVLLVGAGIVGTVVVAIINAKRQPDLKNGVVLPVIEPKDYEVDLGIGTAEILSEGAEYKCLWVNDLTIDDIGLLGEKLRETYPTIPEHHNKVQVEVNVYDFDAD